MLKEACSAPEVIAAQLAAHQQDYARLGERLRAAPPVSVVTVARGSSDHASSFLAYLLMSRIGKLVTSLPMSLVTLYKSPLDTQNVFAVATSQSGQSPDVVEPIRFFRQGGGLTAALVNHPDSPLGEAAEWTLPLMAGPEQSVAATKSFIASLVAGARLVANWQNDRGFLSALDTLPDSLQQATRADWRRAIDVLAGSDKLMVVGRGISFPVALEAALKCKETSSIQAEAFSGAEIKHGPMALIDEGYPLLIFATRGPALDGLVSLAREMRGRGARVLLVAPPEVAERDLTLPTATLPEFDPITAIQAFYVMAAQLAEARGMDPDKPRHLNKVTKTS